MKKLACLVLLVAILMGGIALYKTFTKETENPEDTAAVEWYDEELKLGYAEDCGYYLVLSTAEDYTAQEREEMHLSDHYVFRITNLRPETVEAIRNGELDV